MRPLTMATFAVVVLACSVPAGLAAHASSPASREAAPGKEAATPALAAAASAPEQAPAPIPGKAGVAVGALKAGPVTVTLAHAYASGPIDSFGDGDLLYMVVLTDRPIEESAIAGEIKRGGQALLQSGKLQGLALLVDSKGSIRNIVPYVGELRGNRMLASAGRLTSFTVQKDRVSGQGALTPEDTMQQGWSFAASWNATLLAAR